MIVKKYQHKKSLYGEYLLKNDISNSEVVQGLEQVMNISLNVLLKMLVANILYLLFIL